MSSLDCFELNRTEHGKAILTVLDTIPECFLEITVTHKSTVARTVMCRQDGRGRFPVLLDDLSKCRTNSQRKSKLS